MIKPISYAELTIEKAKAGCFVWDIPNEEYHSYNGISKSGLDLIDRSPAHYAYAAPFKSTRAMEIGTAIHCAILEPNEFKKEYILLKQVNDRRSSEYKQAVKATGSGAMVLTGPESDYVSGMMISAQGNTEWTNFISKQGYSELSAFVQCPNTGALIRARFDRLTTDGECIDIKKTQDARYESFQKSVVNYRYHVQDSFYSYIYECITGQPLKSFKFMAIEEKAPNTCKIYELDDEAKSVGRDIAISNLKTFAECENSNEWPTINTDTELMSLPYWALPEGYDEVIL